MSASFAPPMLRPGDTINGRYAVLEHLGIGGMGSVYRARDTTLNREVALKLLRVDKGEPGEGSGGTGPLLREARTAAALEHPNVVAIYDVGKVDAPAALEGAPYLAMELVRGEPLRERLKDPRVPT